MNDVVEMLELGNAPLDEQMPFDHCKLPNRHDNHGIAIGVENQYEWGTQLVARRLDR
jgi:hypothetical protein